MNLPNLNLLNFELPQSKQCKYVLTSPRSLKACRKAGIKPVDLLYKCLKDVEKEMGDKERAQEKYQAYEKERQRKLGICRRIRNELLIKGFHGKNTKDKKIKSEDEKTFPALTSKCNKQECQENSKNAEKALHYEKNKIKDVNDLEEKVIKLEKPQICPILDKKKISRPHSALGNVLIKELEINEKVEEENLSVNDSLHKLDLYNPKEKVASKFLPEITKKEICFEDINNNTKVSNRPRSEFKRKKEKRRAKSSNKCVENDYTDPEYCLLKYKQVIENSIDREIREMDVKRVQRQIEEGMERWQDRVLLLQWLDSQRAQEQAAKVLEVKVERLQQKQRNKDILHTMNINKVKEEEDIKAEILRREIEIKNKKIHVLNQEKERVIYECKNRAHTVTDLKEQIRSIMSPETFDKKITKYGFEKKTTLPGMCPRLMQTSHIRLG